LVLSNKIYRNPKQCREHWNCYLDPNIKKGFWEKRLRLLIIDSGHIVWCKKMGRNCKDSQWKNWECFKK